MSLGEKILSFWRGKTQVEGETHEDFFKRGWATVASHEDNDYETCTMGRQISIFPKEGSIDTAISSQQH